MYEGNRLFIHSSRRRVNINQNANWNSVSDAGMPIARSIECITWCRRVVCETIVVVYIIYYIGGSCTIMFYLIFRAIRSEHRMFTFF